MNNREWLYSLEPDALAAWFEAEHSDALGAEQAPMMGHTPECEQKDTADGESDGSDDVSCELIEALEAAYAKNRSLRRHIRKMQEGRNGWHIKAEKLQEEVGKLEKQVDKLKAESDGWRMRCGTLLDAASAVHLIAEEWDEGGAV